MSGSLILIANQPSASSNQHQEIINSNSNYNSHLKLELELQFQTKFQLHLQLIIFNLNNSDQFWHGFSIMKFYQIFHWIEFFNLIELKNWISLQALITLPFRNTCKIQFVIRRYAYFWKFRNFGSTTFIQCILIISSIQSKH